MSRDKYKKQKSTNKQILNPICHVNSGNKKSVNAFSIALEPIRNSLQANFIE